MKIIGFTGHAGTGKSTKAIKVATDNKLDFIIDDGLLINAIDKSIVAGLEEKTKNLNESSQNPHKQLRIMVYAALFEFNNAYSIKKSIEKQNPKGILILGTSQKMIERIKNNLSLPEVDKFIRIQDIAKKEEIDNAMLSRNKGGHSIPVNYEQVKDALKHLKKTFGDNSKIEAYDRGNHVQIIRDF